MDVFSELDRIGTPNALLFSDPGSGLNAILVIDDTTLGPAAGGVRTRAYARFEDALEDVAGLARSMTLKNALAGLDAGGGKMVVLDHPGLDRERAFRFLGRRIEELGGLFRTAGDLGTRAADLQAMASETRFVHTNEGELADSVARGLLRCVEALTASRHQAIAQTRFAVQGAGAIGAACAKTLVDAGGAVQIADIDGARARQVADQTGAALCEDARGVLYADVDVLVPCAIGGVLDQESAPRLRAWGVCGAANGILANAETGRLLHARGVCVVPDVLASAGAVIDGIGESVMGLADRTPLIDRLGELATTTLVRATREDRPPTEVAWSMARQRIARAGRERAAVDGRDEAKP